MTIMKAVINNELISTQIYSILLEHQQQIIERIGIDIKPLELSEIISNVYDEDLLHSLNLMCASEDEYVRETCLGFKSDRGNDLVITCIHYVAGEIQNDQMTIHSRYIFTFDIGDRQYKLYEEMPFTVNLLDD